MTLCSATPNPVSRTAHSAYSRAFSAPARAAACTTRSTACLSYRANARAAHSARCSMARARGTPAGSVSTSKLIAWPGSAPGAAAVTSATPATPGSPRPVMAGPGLAGGERDGLLRAVEQLVAQRGGHQHARLVLEHPGVEGGEDRPHARLVQAPHDELGVPRVVELQPH